MVKLDLKGLNRTQKKIAKEEAGRLLIEGIQQSLDESLSPVSGGSFKRTTKDGDRSILFEEGDLREAIVSKNRSDDRIEVGVFKSSERKKAYNHNMGSNNSSNSTVPERRFIPDENQTFKKKVMDRVDRRLKEIKRGQKETNIEELQTTTLDRLFNEATRDASATGSSDGPNLRLTIGALLDVFDGE